MLPQLEDVLADLSEGVLVESADGYVVWVNQAWCDLLGVPVAAPQWVGANVGALLGSSHGLQDLASFVSRAHDAACDGAVDECRLEDGRVLRRRVVSSARGRVTLLEPPSPEPVEQRVLVVDDNPVNRTLLEGMLTVLGIVSDAVDDGQQALDALARREYAAVVMDVAMPVLDGHEATRRLRAGETTRRTPVLALTAAGSADDRRRSLEAGMDAFLVKPVSIDELRSALAPYLAPPASAETSADTPAGTGQVLDLERLTSLEEQLGDTALVRYAVETYLEELPGRTAAIVESLAGDAREDLRRASHTLKSSSAMLGALALSQLCAAVEVGALTGRPEELRSTVAALQQSVEHTASALAGWAAARR